MKTQPFMYLVGYDQNFIKNCQTGWGCGYVAIPTKSNLVKNHFQQIEKDQSETDYYVSDYLQIGEQEITYTRSETINGVEYLVIGFDTAHIYNNSSHNFQYVFTETAKLLEAVNDAVLLAQHNVPSN